jgi:NAD(P)-dependent dehydrogenase (short-subunit alcohol dehydrogenase family)
VVLGASSGFGAECAMGLAAAGYDICGVHLDRKAGLAQVEDIRSRITATGRRALYFNVNAADAEKRAEVVEALVAEQADVKVMLHSLAFGTLKPFVGDDRISEQQMDMTLAVMAHSLVYWTQDLVAKGLLTRGARVFSMTSSGSTRAIFAYGAVSAAKCALESHTRQLAYELAPLGIAVNALRAGVTDTPALRKIPGNDRLLEGAAQRNPAKRLTRPSDVAGALVALCHPAAGWVSLLNIFATRASVYPTTAFATPRSHTRLTRSTVGICWRAGMATMRSPSSTMSSSLRCWNSSTTSPADRARASARRPNSSVAANQVSRASRRRGPVMWPMRDTVRQRIRRNSPSARTRPPASRSTIQACHWSTSEPRAEAIARPTIMRVGAEGRPGWIVTRGEK